MTAVFDDLYARSKDGEAFTNLMEIITSEENILLAYRNFKRNNGSYTPGSDKLAIRDLEKCSRDEVVRRVRNKLKCYHPKPVRRVEIPKADGKKRPLGIPSIWDRMVQQAILQVLDPICEAKFFERSNGFRPNRSAEHAIAQCMKLIQKQHMYLSLSSVQKALLDLYRERFPAGKIACCAPTGKAARRMEHSTGIHDVSQVTTCASLTSANNHG